MRNLREGEVVGKKDIRAIRPGFGLPPKRIDTIIGKKLNCNVERGDPVKLEFFVD